MRKRAPAVHDIRLQLDDLAQLFNSMDPTPFHHRDLDPDAEQFIESWALEFPARASFALTIVLDRFPPSDPTVATAEAIHNYFRYKEGLARRELSQLLRRGRISLAIGLSFLVLLFLATDVAAKFPAGPFTSVVRDSLTIGGWVAMWRPMQIFLYDWWPIGQRRRVYHSLSESHISVLPQSAAAPTSDAPVLDRQSIERTT